MNIQQCLAIILTELAERPLTIEHRPQYGWFVVDRGQTLMGFQTLELLGRYVEKAAQRNQLYTPTARETYGR